MTEIAESLIEQELTYDGITMVHVSLSFPVISGLSKSAGKRINTFYSHHAKALLSRIKKRVLPRAISEYTLSLENSVLFKPFEASLRFTVTYNDGSILSLYREFHFRCGKTRRVMRHGDTWNCASGWFLPLESFFPHRAKFKKQLINNALSIAQKQEESGTHRYFDGFRRLIRKHFSKDRFYLTEDGTAIFFDEKTIAPQAEGICVFVAPSLRQTTAESKLF